MSDIDARAQTRMTSCSAGSPATVSGIGTRPPLDDDARALCATTAKGLAAAAATGSPLGLGLGALALLACAWQPSNGVAWWVVAAVPLERYLAFRVRFDAGLFEQAAADAGYLARLDPSLAVLGLLRTAAGDRPLADRVHGARRLALRHGTVVVLQTLVAAVAAWQGLAGAA